MVSFSSNTIIADYQERKPESIKIKNSKIHDRKHIDNNWIRLYFEKKITIGVINKIDNI